MPRRGRSASSRTRARQPERHRGSQGGAADLLRFNAGDKEKTANQLGWKLRELDNRLLLLNCAPEVQKAVIERHPHISIGHAELLAGLPQDRQVKVLAGIPQHKVPIEVLKKQLGQYAKRLSEAIFDTAQCPGCPHNWRSRPPCSTPPSVRATASTRPTTTNSRWRRWRREPSRCANASR